jgi:hypothetical protein
MSCYQRVRTNNTPDGCHMQSIAGNHRSHHTHQLCAVAGHVQVSRWRPLQVSLRCRRGSVHRWHPLGYGYSRSGRNTRSAVSVLCCI